MEQDQYALERKSGIPEHPERTAGIASVATGAIVGAGTALFAFAGPVAILVGGVIGAAAGGVVALYVRERSKRERARDERLDREMGVSGGDIGAAPPSAAG